MSSMSRLATTWMPVLTVAYMAATMAQVAHGEDAAAAAAASASDSTESLLKPSFTQCVDIMTGGDLFNAACVKLVIMKALGFAIIAGSFTLKVPQIKNILAAGTVSGLSFVGMYIETLGFLSTTVFHLLSQSPISAYGENVVIVVQNLFIVYLLWSYGKPGAVHIATAATVLVSLPVAEYMLVPEAHWSKIVMSTIPIAAAARLPQIVDNFRNGHTGVLAVITVFLSFAGSAARVVTSSAEVKDPWVARGFQLSTLWNFILLAQIIVYWNKTNQVLAKLEAEKKK